MAKIHNPSPHPSPHWGEGKGEGCFGYSVIVKLEIN
jgi:hypothetical protein